jgi:hypothetical protein
MRPNEKIVQVSVASHDACLGCRICLLVKLILTACIICQSRLHAASHCMCAAIGRRSEECKRQCTPACRERPLQPPHARLRQGDRKATSCLCVCANLFRGLEFLACTQGHALSVLRHCSLAVRFRGVDVDVGVACCSARPPQRPHAS